MFSFFDRRYANILLENKLYVIFSLYNVLYSLTNRRELSITSQDSLKMQTFLNKNKIMESKDIIEIAIYYQMLNIDQIYELILILYNQSNLIRDIDSVYPISLYKLLIEYDCIQIFEKLLKSELSLKQVNPGIISNIISKIA